MEKLKLHNKVYFWPLGIKMLSKVAAGEQDLLTRLVNLQLFLYVSLCLGVLYELVNIGFCILQLLVIAESCILIYWTGSIIFRMPTIFKKKNKNQLLNFAIFSL